MTTAKTTPPWYNPEPESEPWQVVLDHTGPWTEDDFHRLPTGIRAELHDGNLLLHSSPCFAHQHAQRMIAMRIAEAMQDMKLVAEASDVRMADGRRYRAPDVIALRRRYHGRPADPDNVLLTVEVISPGGGDEWTAKKQVYAEAGIPAYLIVQHTASGFEAWHHTLENGKYRVTAQAGPGEILRFTEPFEFVLAMSELD